MLVYVQNKHGKPLMPCSPRKARLLLKQKKAKVIKRTPFTIQLIYGSSGYKQAVSLGVDAGSRTIGLSATTVKKVLYEAEVELRNDITKLLADRRELRRSRRYRKTRYRKPRFDNRRRPEGWLAPSVRNKIEAHTKAVQMVCKMLPVTKITIEVASFDIQKLKNPEISGVEYQQGEQLGFWNVREYVLWRDGHQCQGRPGCRNKVLNVHHIESRKTGGDAPNNLITLCDQCHKDYHTGKLKLNLKRGQSFKDAAFMGIMRWMVYNRLKTIYPYVRLTYGYITKHTRIANGLEKNHRTDARCVSGNPQAQPDNTWYYFKQVRKQNRQLHKANPIKRGIWKANKAPKYLFGYQLFDKVLYEGQECFIFGRRASGYFDLRKLDGTRVSPSVSCKKLKLLERASIFLCERRNSDFLPGMNSGVSVA
ncbi:HNH endonuclease [Thermanaerosceptrum fracticalcis]|uniref:HNH endonuclease n=1 Tax=Thermanaerosceptrum fracticalcis TaxID=1712410 RepID=A0A7G6DZV8_THEFR|nr:RNA-guided endonuclease IscB [Thermanaerosceptrum fracticalcis]QNB45362.1 HNH endonuclease [Thermanaerosceptrum fracticalcis]